MTPDYSKYTLDELKEAISSIDKYKYPDRFELIESEMEDRLSNPENHKNIEVRESVDPDWLNEQKEFRLSNWVQFFRSLMILGMFFWMTFINKNTDFIPLGIIGLIIILSFIIYEIYTLPFKVEFTENALIFKSHKNKKTILIQEIEKIGYHFLNSMYFVFTLKNGDSIKTGSSILFGKHFFKRIKKQNLVIDIHEKFIKNWQ
jgi:hypothetical protein